MKQLSLTDLPRSRPRRKLMHVVDAGHGEMDGYATGWTVVQTVTEAKRGVPCPKCSP